jgi:two-component system sensor histidine kinase RegB
LRFPVSYRLSDDFATYLLGFDILQLAVLLFLSGGLANPFSIFFLAPVATSAVSLPWRNALVLLGLSLFCDTILEFWSLPLKIPGDQPLALPQLINVGLWFAYSLSAVFVAFYGNRVASEARQLASALNATELILARAQHLSQLDGLAAAAAHELGTPLATVQLVVHELAAQPKIADLCIDDLNLAEEQIARCRTILGKLSSPAEMADHALDEGGLANFIEEIAAPHRLQDIEIDVEIAGEGEEPSCGRNPAILYGLTNLIENAVGFAASRVTIQASWTPAEVRITIMDDGPGFPVQVLAHIGEPYISDRAAARRGEGEPAGGLGLGLFIAKALLERSGAKLTIANAVAEQRGAIATIAWPFISFEQAGNRARNKTLEFPE